MDGRKSMGTPKDGVLIPVAPSLAEVPDSYADMRDTIITKIKESRVRFAVQVNTGMMVLYWEIGNEIPRRQRNEGWGAKIPWRSNIVLMDKLADEQTRLWYAQKLIENGWSSNILDMMIASRLIERQGKAVNNCFSTI